VKTAQTVGDVPCHHNETVQAGGLKVKTSVKAGTLTKNHNETVVRA
jgi:hypothetical protein